MFESVLFWIHSALITVFGICLSAAFSGIRLTPKNIINMLLLAAFSGILQLILFFAYNEEIVWLLYPLLVHVPTVLWCRFVHRKRISTALVSVFTAYLCCQPGKWFGILFQHITQSDAGNYLARIITLLVVGFVFVRFLADYLSELFNKDTRSVWIFGFMPTVYYIFDYATVVYTDFWLNNNRIVAEFLPFFLCITFVVFCVVYYKEYEQKADAEHREQIIHIAVDQLSKEMETIKQNEKELRLLRHDMRHFLNSLAVCISTGDLDKTNEMIASYTSFIDGTRYQSFCSFDIINYVLSDFREKCKAGHIEFEYTVELAEVKPDELLFSSIIHNALDNAYNAQLALPETKRKVKLMLKTLDGKLLLSVRNPVETAPAFVDGMPVSSRNGHGYGTQSIRYMTRRLGGHCNFSVEDGMFSVRVVV